MKLKFAKLDPTRNMTIIVRSPVPRCIQPEVAAKLMAENSVCAEQVGFQEEATLDGALARLQMMGGEFCGNATMSLAALLAYEEGMEEGAEKNYPLEISGADELFSCRIRRVGDAYRGSVHMPLPESIGKVEMESGLSLPVVRFPGIAHVIVPEGCMDAAAAKAVIPRWCRQLGVDALGIMLVNREMNCVRPLVYVRETDSSVWEQGCGSGSAALGAYLSFLCAGAVHTAISQPGGTIEVSASWQDGAVRALEISGIVKIAAIGEAMID